MTQEKNICQQLDEKLGPLLEEAVKDLNKWSFGQPTPGVQPGGLVFMPNIVSLGNFTKVSRTVDAFNLESPSGGMIKDKKVDIGDLGDIIVIRRILGYVLSLRIINNDVKIDSIKPLIKEMINVLLKERGFSPDKLNMGIYATFKRPGNNYFYETENYAGYELRLYSSTTLAE